MAVLTHDGAGRLGTCLRSVSSQEVPAEVRLEVVVVDNGSVDPEAIALAAGEAGPDVRVVHLDENLGFAGGYQHLAQELDADYLLLLNDDTAMTPGALAALWSQVEQGRECVGARLVSWDLERIDFDGGGASWTGHGHPLRHGEIASRTARTDQRATASRSSRAGRRGQADLTEQVDDRSSARPTLFCSGAAMLVRRSLFLEVGGFDPAYFAYYEDVDLGWRLWLTGHEVWHVPGAVVRHAGGATAGALGRDRRWRLHERNALRNVCKLYDDATLSCVLPAALALAAVRSGAPVDVIATAKVGQGTWPPVPNAGWPGWDALAPLRLDLEGMLAPRVTLQSMRRRDDREIVALMGTPFAPVPATREATEAMRRAIDVFELEEVLGAKVPAATLSSRARGSTGLARRALATFRDDGLSAVVDETRRYVAWWRAGRP